jgi:hypothetical protein
MKDNRSLVNAIRGPVTLITLGVLFALNNFTNYGFDKTWPVLLIVFGLLSLMRRGVEPAPPAPSFPPPNFPPPNFPPPNFPPQGSYSHSPYAQPAPSKGGFGGSAPKSDAPSIAPPKGDTE